MKNVVQHLKVGQVIPTQTIISKQGVHSVESLPLGSCKVTENGHQWVFPLSEHDVVYGLGQSMRGMNKRGYVYESFCSDDPSHTPDKTALYGAHNFFVVIGERTWGLYTDLAGKISHDVGFSDRSSVKLDIEGENYDMYYFEGSYQWITSRFREMIGQSYVPPKWAFGYQQSRWSYENQDVVREIANTMQTYDIPCDAIYLDIDYMERFKDFSTSDTRFPDFETFVSDMRAKGIRLVPIIDAGVKIEAGYDVYEEGIEKGYFVQGEDGEPFVAAVWPGRVHFPDFLNAEARAWFGRKYHTLIDMGIEGFWNDMNEPAIFYSEAGLQSAIEYVSSKQDENLDIYSFFELKDRILGLSNADKDYKSMYHLMDGKRVNHFDVHNLYGYNMTQSAAEGMLAYNPEKRFLLLTRASHIGMAKYSGIWTGDNASWWEHLKLNLQMLPGLNMAGFVYSGADTGGFGSHCSAELLTRWIQLSIFTPLFRNHSAMGTRQQEPWAFDTETLKRVRHFIRLRYAMMPYHYTEYIHSVLDHTMLFSPLARDYDDLRVRGVEDQVLYGQSLMLAPVLEQNARGRYVYLPEPMLLWQVQSVETLSPDTMTLMPKGDHYIQVSLDEVPMFIRQNQLVPLCRPANQVDKLMLDDISLVGFVPSNASYTIWDDDGVHKNYRQRYVRVTVSKYEGQFNVHIETNVHELQTVTLYLMDEHGKVHCVKQTECDRKMTNDRLQDKC